MLDVVVDGATVVVVVPTGALVAVVEDEDVEDGDGGWYAGRDVGDPSLTDAPTDLWVPGIWVDPLVSRTGFGAPRTAWLVIFHSALMSP